MGGALSQTHRSLLGTGGLGRHDIAARVAEGEAGCAGASEGARKAHHVGQWFWSGEEQGKEDERATTAGN